jgi:hypothetical protein
MLKEDLHFKTILDRKVKGVSIEYLSLAIKLFGKRGLASHKLDLIGLILVDSGFDFMNVNL